MKYCSVVWILFVSMVLARDISGLYLTHKDTEGGQSIVEIFQYNGKYYVYGLKNLENNPIEDSCNKHTHLRSRKSVGVVFGYNYTPNDAGEFDDGYIYNFYNCKTYYGKIVPHQDGTIDFVGALDPLYLFSKTFKWRTLTPKEAQHYESYRQSFEDIIQTIEDTYQSR